MLHSEPWIAALALAVSIALVAGPVRAQDERAASAEPPAEGSGAEEEAEEIIVQGTRFRRRVQDETLRVEVVSREEIEEKLLMRPGHIAMLVNETGGVRVQVTSPALGAANIRVQGMEGRYTQLLADGLPLFGGQGSSLGLLQIPPTDLGQVEIIKGAASALYGASALGGVINLISRRPGDEPEAEMLLNATSRHGQDSTAYLAGPLGAGLAASITGGYHRQSAHDLDRDGWIDIPRFDRWTIRPRLFWSGRSGTSAYLTLGAMKEDRVGGTLPGRLMPDGAPFPRTQDTQRLDAGLVAEAPLAGLGTAHLRASGTTQRHEHRFGPVMERDRHSAIFAEASVAGGSEATPWAAGLAFQRDSYRSDSFPAFDYRFDVPGLFAQAEHKVRDDLTLAASARLDAHDEYGTQFSPRVSVLYRPGAWRIRASLGRGFYAPAPFVEEIEEAGLSRLEPLDRLRVETARTASVDVGYSRGPIEASLNLFASDIHAATRLETVDLDRVRLVNVEGPTRIRGAELLLRYRWNRFTATGSYLHVDSTEPAETGGGRRAVPLTPRHAGGVVAMWEDHDRGRLGFEAYYTGRQQLEDNPFRPVGRPYVHLGILGEVVAGPVRLFLNAENLLNVRQTKYDPLVRPSRAPDGRWTVDVWAPTDGFVINAGVRLRLGGNH